MSWNIKKWNWSGTFVTISTTIFAFVSLVSVFISITTWQTQREAARPYFTFVESPSIHLTDELSFEFEFKFKNVGTHPAVNLTSRTIVFEQQLLQKPILIDDYTVVNDIPRDTTTSLLLCLNDKDLFKEPNVNPHFIIMCLGYADPIVHKTYTQTLYLKWAGVVDRRQLPLIHVQMSEKDSIIRYLKTHHLL